MKVTRFGPEKFYFYLKLQPTTQNRGECKSEHSVITIGLKIFCQSYLCLITKLGHDSQLRASAAQSGLFRYMLVISVPVSLLSVLINVTIYGKILT